MSKKLKLAFISVLAAILSFCIVILANPSVFANAENITTTNISDDNFSFVAGAYIPGEILTEDPTSPDFDLATANTRLRFDFKLENFDYENFADLINHPMTWWGNLSYNVFIYEFTLYRSNNDGDGEGNLGTAEPQYSVMVVIFSNKYKTFYGYVAEKNYYGTGSLSAQFGFLSGTPISLSALGYDYYDYIATAGTVEVEGETQKTYGKGYTVTERRLLSKNNLNFIQSDGLRIPLVADVISPFQQYFIKARYHFTTVSGAGMFNTDYSHDYGEIYSSFRSVAQCLQNAYNAGVDFDEEFGDYAEYANLILAVENTTTVRVKYLTEIEGTPYATDNYAYVDVPVLSNTIYISDVEQALGKDLSKCLDSNAYCFQKTTNNDGDLYQLYYLKNVWLRTATVDGNYFDYFLDINGSYKDVYYPYVAAGVLNDDIYEWVFSTQMMNRFPALQDYTFNRIYGYFGLVVVPETYTLNSALKTLFDVNTSKIGVISNFVFERSLSYDGYQSLLTDYNYGFLSKAWSEVTGFVYGSEHLATYYLIYSEPGTENALIGEGGQTDAEDPGSVIENNIIKPAGKVIKTFGFGVFDFFLGVGSNIKLILWIVLIVVAIYLGYKYLKPNSNKRSKK